jgi:small subunit ribosomal protein S3
MGQKVNPIGIRLGFTKESNSLWYPNCDTFANTLKIDISIRDYINKNLSKSYSISKIFIERLGRSVKIFIFSSKPGMVIGKKGEDIEKLRSNLSKLYNISVNINVEEIKKPDLDSLLVAENIGMQLKRRIAFRRAMKRAVSNAIRQGAKGIKVSISGRLGGADIARREWYKEGRIPLHTFKADIDYAFTEIKTTYGMIGIKVWIYKGDIIISNNKSKGSTT